MANTTGVGVQGIQLAAANPYTDGCVCAKVGRYAERVHHPERLEYPLLRSKQS